MLAAIVFLVTYGVELFDFGLSIDEEAATYVTDNVQSALGQGRWGISLILLCIPSLGAIPLIASLLFGLGLLYATWRAFEDFALSRRQAYVFAAIHVAFPMWLHIVQFSTLASSFGIGLAAAAAGAGLAAHGTGWRRVLGALLIAFAISVYQTLALYSSLYVVFCLYAVLIQQNGGRPTKAFWRQAGGALLALAASAVLYVVIQKLGLWALQTKISYVDVFFQADRLLREPGPASRAILEYVWLLASGRHSAYLGWGGAVMFLPWLGLLPIALPGRDTDRKREFSSWLWVLVVAAIGLAILAVPTVLSVATLPLRAYVALPLLAGWLASRVTFAPWTKPAYLHAAALGYFVLVSASISARLFYSDQVVHNADVALTHQLMHAIERTADKSATGGAVPFALVGTRRYGFDGQLKRTEQFGASFYEQDGGNVYRVAYFMKIQGAEMFQPVWLGHRPELIPAAKQMPIWPADGSVRLVNGVVLVKIGHPTPEQLKGP